jgi:quinol monooxygenase YgiN
VATATGGVVAQDMRKRTIDEPGCIDYRFWSATDDPDAILLFEQWQEQSDIAAHLAAPHMAAPSRRSGPPSTGPLR